jgi:hypothetical protein
MKSLDSMKRGARWTRIVVYIVIPGLQRALGTVLCLVQSAAVKVDDLGFSLAKRLVGKTEGRSSHIHI